MVVHVYNLSTWRMKVGVSGIRDHSQLHNKFNTSLGYMRPCLEEEKEEKEAERKEEYRHYLWKSSMLEDPNSTHSIKLSAGLYLLLWMTLCPGASLVSHVCSLWSPHFSLS